MNQIDCKQYLPESGLPSRLTIDGSGYCAIGISVTEFISIGNDANIYTNYIENCQTAHMGG